ncbi:MAG: dTMP kinase [Aquificae bacterium]|nr:dTMP kinase [Aquificota bacterium]
MFVVFEGIDGTGKTTLSKMLAHFLAKRGIKTLWTREPYSPELREFLLKTELSPWEETFLFLADRGRHVRELIKPKLEEGFTVVSDRFYLSTLAYQGFGRGLPLEELKNLNRKVTENLKPDLVFVLDLPPEEALKRSGKTGQSADRFEKLDFLKKVREGFLKLAEEEENTFLINAGENLHSVFGKVLKILDDRLSKSQA